MNFLEQTLQALREGAGQPWILQGELAVTGAELLRHAGSAQAALRAAGVGAGERVVLLGPNSPEWIALDLAIQCEGAVRTAQGGFEVTGVVQVSCFRKQTRDGSERCRSYLESWNPDPHQS